MNQLVTISSPMLPAIPAAPASVPARISSKFFAANIRNPHTRRADARAADKFLASCASVGVSSIAAVQRDVGRMGTRELAAPNVKQRLAAMVGQFEIQGAYPQL